MSIEYYSSSVYQDLGPSAPLTPKDNRKFWILLVKTFGLKPTNKSNTSSYYRKYGISSIHENSLIFLQIINFVKISKHIFKQTRDYSGNMQNKNSSSTFSYVFAYSGIIEHVLTYSGIIRHIQKLFKHIQIYSEPYVTMVC